MCDSAHNLVNILWFSSTFPHKRTRRWLLSTMRMHALQAHILEFSLNIRHYRKIDKQNQYQNKYGNFTIRSFTEIPEMA